MYIKEKQTSYVSDIDLFLLDYDKKHPELSTSQQKEIAKFQRIYRLRDDATSIEPTNKIWDEF